MIARLGVDVAVVTDSDFREPGVTTIVVPRTGSTDREYRDGERGTTRAPFLNGSRHTAYDTSPFDQTIVLDVDYVIRTDTLNLLWDSASEILVAGETVLPDGSAMLPGELRISDHGPRMLWATVCYFRKGALAGTFFDTVEHVRDEWDYYTMLYGLQSGLFRNDHAFTIAAHLLNGNVDDGLTVPTVPFPVVAITDRDRIVSVDSGGITCLFGGDSVVRSTGVDLHCMNKFSMLEHLEALCQ